MVLLLLFQFDTSSKLVTFHVTGDAPSDKPTVLWSMYFNQAISDSSCVVDLPSNIHVLSLPGVNIGFGEALFQVHGLSTAV